MFTIVYFQILLPMWWLSEQLGLELQNCYLFHILRCSCRYFITIYSVVESNGWTVYIFRLLTIVLMYIYGAMSPGPHATGSSQQSRVSTPSPQAENLTADVSSVLWAELQWTRRVATDQQSCMQSSLTRVAAKSSAPHPASKSYQDGYLWGRGIARTYAPTRQPRAPRAGEFTSQL